MRAARFAAAAHSAAVGLSGTTILPATESASPSPLVSTTIQPGAKGSARWLVTCCGLINSDVTAITRSGYRKWVTFRGLQSRHGRCYLLSFLYAIFRIKHSRTYHSNFH